MTIMTSNEPDNHQARRAEAFGRNERVKSEDRRQDCPTHHAEEGVRKGRDREDGDGGEYC